MPQAQNDGGRAKGSAGGDDQQRCKARRESLRPVLVYTALKLRVYEALATSACGLKLLVYAALSY
jgi:hypothetical protein